MLNSISNYFVSMGIAGLILFMVSGLFMTLIGITLAYYYIAIVSLLFILFFGGLWFVINF